MFLGRLLPPHHLGDETKSVVTLASDTLSALSALVIGLLISNAKGVAFKPDRARPGTALGPTVLN